MARRIDKVQLVYLPVTGGVVQRDALALMVMPRSRSMSMESSTCSSISRALRPPQCWINRSASVDFPWSIWAIMENCGCC